MPLQAVQEIIQEGQKLIKKVWGVLADFTSMLRILPSS